MDNRYEKVAEDRKTFKTAQIPSGICDWYIKSGIATNDTHTIDCTFTDPSDPNPNFRYNIKLATCIFILLLLFSFVKKYFILH